MPAEWYFKELGQVLGPVTAAELRRLAVEGDIGRDSWIRKGAAGQWVLADRVKGLLGK